MAGERVEGHRRAGADMADDLGGGHAGEAARRFKWQALGDAEEEACRIEIARARRIDDFGNRFGGNRDVFAVSSKMCEPLALRVSTASLMSRCGVVCSASS